MIGTNLFGSRSADGDGNAESPEEQKEASKSSRSFNQPGVTSAPGEGLIGGNLFLV
jgi:hypothetical protein